MFKKSESVVLWILKIDHFQGWLNMLIFFVVLGEILSIAVFLHVGWLFFKAPLKFWEARSAENLN